MTDAEINIAVAEACGWVWDFNDAKEARWLNKAKPLRAEAFLRTVGKWKDPQ